MESKYQRLPDGKTNTLFGSKWNEWRVYFKNLNTAVSALVIIFALFLSFVSWLYAFGQVTQLQLTNYWCDLKDLETIQQHSIEKNLNQGTEDGCWKSKQFTV